MTNEIRDHGAFDRHIADLNIELSVNQEGIFTACTTSEPFFCYDADTKEELAVLVGETLSSYGRLFFGITDLSINVVERNQAPQGIELERGTPIGQLKPQLDLAA